MSSEPPVVGSPAAARLWAAAPPFPAGSISSVAGAPRSGAAPPSDAGELVSAEALLAWRRRLLQVGGAGADLDWLLDLAGGLPWSELQGLRLQPQRRVTLQRSLQALEAIWCAHRQGAGPLQYLVGCCPWRDLNLEVGPGVLIPRQETELLVELLLHTQAPARGGTAEDALELRPAPALWADLGTGSGCLAIALARTFPASQGLAVDLSGAALAQARRNLDAQGLTERVSLLRGSWWEPLQPWWGRFELAIANPPYIPSAVVANLDPLVRDHEPRLALDGGADGLTCLRAIVAAAPLALAPGGLLLVEHHHDQSPAVLALMQAAGLHNPQAFRDLEGVRRFAAAIRPPDAVRPAPGATAAGPGTSTGPDGRASLAGGGLSGLD
ncbi:MAG: peptide chain release factor N(5)-glutamine methyltransferase [Synechococcaceae cyanobacterium]